MDTPELVAFAVTESTPEIRFLASLSDGRTVIEDVRSGQEHAWHRLREFLRDKPELKITCLRLQAPGGREFVTPANQRGYVLGKRGQIVFGMGEAHEIGIGYFDGQCGVINWLSVPTLNRGRTEERAKDRLGFYLIENS